MAWRQQTRRMASLLLTIALGLWAETGLAMPAVSGHGPQCGMHMSHLHRAAAPATHGVWSGCCPRHITANAACPSHRWLQTSFQQRPDCCALKNQPRRPCAYLIASGELSLESAMAASGTSRMASASRFAGSGSTSPSFVKPVFDCKTELRI